jgi:hypothetical protein
VCATIISDVRLEVDAVQTSGPENGTFGLVCRHLSGDDYYALVIGSDGYFGIGLVENGDKIRWLQEGSAPAGLIKPGEAANRIRADCVGNILSLYANGQKLAEVLDDTFAAGDTGLLAATRKESGGGSIRQLRHLHSLKIASRKSLYYLSAIWAIHSSQEIQLMSAKGSNEIQHPSCRIIGAGTMGRQSLHQQCRRAGEGHRAG